MKITIKNIIKENKDIDPKQRYINGIVNIIRLPYFKFLRVNEIPKELWNDIFSKLFNQEVIISDNMIFDKNDNRLYFEDSVGYWSKREYDENNNKIYQVDSTGNWLKQEYDSNNNLIYYEDYEGYWEKRVYDENNKMIYSENPYGTIIDKRSSNSLNENTDPKQKYINGILNMIRPPYLRFLKVNEIPIELWEDILSNIFNTKVTYYNDRIYNSNNNNIYYEDSGGYWEKFEYDSNNNIIYSEDSDGYWEKFEYDSNNNEIYYENSDGRWLKREYDSNNNIIYSENPYGTIIDNRPSNSLNEDIDPKQKYVNGILNMIRRPYMEFLINNEVPEELWKDILTKIFNTNDISWEKRIIDNKILYQLIIENEKGKQLYYETHDYWEQLIYGHHNRLDMDFTWYINSVGSKKVTLVGKHNPVVYSNGPTGYPWSSLSDDVKNNKFFDINY